MIMKGVVPNQDGEWDKLLSDPLQTEIKIAMDFNATRFSAVLSLIVVETDRVLNDNEEVTIKTRMVKK